MKIHINEQKLNHQYGYRIIKRLFDMVASSIAVVLLSPLFLIIAICIFVLVKIINKLMHFKKQEEEKAAPKKSDEVLLLEEIRDLLKKEQPKKKKNS